MYSQVKSFINDASHLIFPHNCENCGSDVLDNKAFLCYDCFTELPKTGLFTSNNEDNHLAKIFYGRLPLKHAVAAYFYKEDGVMQPLLASMKYQKNREMGLYLGRLLGNELASVDWFSQIDAIVPIPINPKKELKRGYNQSNLLCEGIHSVCLKPIIIDAIIKTEFAESQTRKNRLQRWENVEDTFSVVNPKALEGKHIALIDDVITTGATIEACGKEILAIPYVSLSVIGLCLAY